MRRLMAVIDKNDGDILYLSYGGTCPALSEVQDAVLNLYHKWSNDEDIDEFFTEYLMANLPDDWEVLIVDIPRIYV